MAANVKCKGLMESINMKIIFYLWKLMGGFEAKECFFEIQNNHWNH